MSHSTGVHRFQDLSLIIYAAILRRYKARTTTCPLLSLTRQADEASTNINSYTTYRVDTRIQIQTSKWTVTDQSNDREKAQIFGVVPNSGSTYEATVKHTPINLLQKIFRPIRHRESKEKRITGLAVLPS